MAFHIEPVTFSELPGWHTDDPTPVIAALRRCHRHVTTAKPYRTGSLGISVDDLLPAFEAAGGNFADAAAARAFFESQYVPFRIRPDERPTGFVTAFYEPEIEVRSVPDGEFRFPFYRRPADLVDIDELNRPEGMDPYFAFGRLVDGRIEEYPDRRAIDEGFLAGGGLEIAYARSKVDVFFIHVQGAARLIYPDGMRRRITYAAKTGHRFSAIGKLLIDCGEIDAAIVSMATSISPRPYQCRVSAAGWRRTPSKWTKFFGTTARSSSSARRPSRIRRSVRWLRPRCRWSRGDRSRSTGSSTLSGSLSILPATP
jgi:membrane-bound lytic murein transglycosylase A